MARNRVSLSSSAPDVYRAIAALDRSVDFDPALRHQRARLSRVTLPANVPRATFVWIAASALAIDSRTPLFSALTAQNAHAPTRVNL